MQLETGGISQDIQQFETVSFDILFPKQQRVFFGFIETTEEGLLRLIMLWLLVTEKKTACCRNFTLFHTPVIGHRSSGH